MTRQDWRAALDDYYRRFTDEWQRKHARTPKLLYHYTTAAGLHGILKTRSMRATHARFLNDPSELDYGAEVLQRVLTHYRSSTVVTPPVEQLFMLLRSEPLLDDDMSSYVICFCAKGDLLSQWRAYGHGGGGYAIAFRAAKMKYNVPNGPHFGLWRVIYDEAHEEALIRNAIDAAIQIVETHTPEVRREHLFIANLAGVVRPVLANYCMTCKNSAFAAEREWRGIYLAGSVNVDLKFREAAKLPVPYYELAIGRRRKNGSFELPIVGVRTALHFVLSSQNERCASCSNVMN